MSSPDPAHQHAVARELVQALESYRCGMDALLAGGCDATQWDRMGDRFDLMRVLAGSLPRVQVSWVELLISRFELTEALWRGPRPGQVTVRLLELHERHRERIAELVRKCAEHYPPAT